MLPGVAQCTREPEVSIEVEEIDTGEIIRLLQKALRRSAKALDDPVVQKSEEFVKIVNINYAVGAMIQAMAGDRTRLKYLAGEW
jgi:hypothetical protein